MATNCWAVYLIMYRAEVESSGQAMAMATVTGTVMVTVMATENTESMENTDIMADTEVMRRITGITIRRILKRKIRGLRS